MRRWMKAILSLIMVAAIVLSNMAVVSVRAEGTQEYQLTIKNDCDAAVIYTVEIDGVSKDVTVEANGTYSETIATGTTYVVRWKEGADSTYSYTTPERTEYTGTVGATEEIYYTDSDGNEYSSDQVSDTVSYGNYSKSTNKYVVDSLMTFTRTYSWFQYKYTNISDSSESYSASSASAARDKIQNAYPVSSGWGMETDDSDLGYCWVYKTVTENTRVTASDVNVVFTADAELKVKEDVVGEFTVAAMNVDGLPSIINSGGPGSTGTKNIGTYIANSGYDLVAISEDFNYHSNLIAGATGYSATTWRGEVGLGNVLGSAAETDGLMLLYKNGIGVAGESWTKWNSVASVSGNQYIEKGFRYYQVTVAEGVTLDLYILHGDAGSESASIESRKSQMQQLADAINAKESTNPVLIMGDTNARYTRDYLKESLIDQISGIKDVWVELIRGEEGYPNFGDPNIVAIDKANEGDTVLKDYPDCEIVDKIFYLNREESDLQLQAVTYEVDNQNYVNSSGSELGDHWPLVVKFEYTIAGDEVCTEHNWTLKETIDPDFVSDGYYLYECEYCGEQKQQAITKLTAKSLADEFSTVKGQQVTLDVLANDNICDSELIASKEIKLFDGNGAQIEGDYISDNKVMYTPSEAGLNKLKYSVEYTLNKGTTYTTEPVEILIYTYGMTDNAYVVSDGSAQTFTDVFADDVVKIDGNDTTFSIDTPTVNGSYGEFVISEDSVVYEPKRFLSGVDKCAVEGLIQDDTNLLNVSQIVSVVPDTVVYYEDSFGANAKSSSESGVVNQSGYGIYFSGNWDMASDSTDNYHGDTVTTTSEGAATAEFTFTGTGFDIISRTDAVASTITVQVWKANENEYTNSNRLAIQIVNTQDEENGELYQVPVIHADCGERDEYYVKLMLTPNLDGSEELNYGNMYVDGIRIYGILTEEEEAQYYSEEKRTEEIVDIHDALEAGDVAFVNAENIESIVTANSLTGSDEQGTSFTDTETLQNYIKVGPNHEAYLQNGNGIAFYAVLNSNVSLEDTKLEISARMPSGATSNGYLKYASSESDYVEYNVVGTTAQYYEIDLSKCIKQQDGVYLVVISNTSEEIMALENIKYTGVTLVSSLENQVSLASDIAPYVRMMNGANEVVEEYPAVLKVTVKSIFGKTKGVVEIQSEETGVTGDSYTFSGADVYQQVKNEGYAIWNTGIKYKEYVVEYGTTEEITVR